MTAKAGRNAPRSAASSCRWPASRRRHRRLSRAAGRDADRRDPERGDDAHGRARSQAQRRRRAGAVAGLDRAEAERVFGDPDAFEVTARTRERAPSCRRCCSCADPDGREHARGPRPSARSRRHGLPRPRPRVRAANRGGGSARGLGLHPRSGGGAAVTLGAAPFHGRLYINNRDLDGREHRPRLAAAAHGPWRAGPRGRRRGDGRHPRRDALHAAHRDAGQPGHLIGDHRAMAEGRGPARGARIPSRAPSRTSRSATRSSRGRAP
jgi:hypothetical protein